MEIILLILVIVLIGVFVYALTKDSPGCEVKDCAHCPFPPCENNSEKSKKPLDNNQKCSYNNKCQGAKAQLETAYNKKCNKGE